jgi:MFS family permease
MNDYRALLAAPKFRGLLLALLCNGLGTWCVIASLPILVAERFGTGMALVLSLGLRILPKALLAPVAGLLLRRFGAARIASIALVPMAVLTALLPFCHSLWLLQALVAMTGTLDVFITPGLLSLRGPVMPTGLEMVGNTLCSAADRTAQVMGPALGGLAVMAGFGPAFVGFAALIAMSAVPVARLRIPLPTVAAWGGRGMLRDAIRVLRTDRQVVGLMVAALTYMVLLGGMRPFLFWANHDWYGGGEVAWTGLLSAQGLGALCGAVVSALFVRRLMRRISPYRLAMIGGILEGSMHLLLLAAQTSLQAMTIVLLAGIPEIVSTAAWFTTLQSRLSAQRQAMFFTFMAPLWDLCYVLGIGSAVLHAEGWMSLSGYWALVSLVATLPLIPLLFQRVPDTGARASTADP